MVFLTIFVITFFLDTVHLWWT